jgi:hypothetical protein
MAVAVDKVQQVEGGYGFNIMATRYRWMTLVYETEAEAKEGRAHALKAVEKATSAVLPK